MHDSFIVATTRAGRTRSGIVQRTVIAITRERARRRRRRRRCATKNQTKRLNHGIHRSMTPSSALFRAVRVAQPRREEAAATAIHTKRWSQSGRKMGPILTAAAQEQGFADIKAAGYGYHLGNRAAITDATKGCSQTTALPCYK